MNIFEIILSAFISFLLPGFGQLYQERKGVAKKIWITWLVLFCLIGIGWVFLPFLHLFAAGEAFVWGWNKPPQNPTLRAAAIALAMLTGASTASQSQPISAAVASVNHSAELKQGYRAFFGAIKRLENPYPVGGRRNAAWDRGWVRAARERKAQREASK